jgi:hypothetical protein
MGLSRAQVSPAVLAVGNLAESERKTKFAEVVPVPRGTDRDRQQTSLVTRFAAIYHVIDPTIGVGPTKQRGRVSIERLLALQDYTQRTSTTRATIVCVLTPIPALLVAATIECLPLAPPSLGWHEQGFFWVRLFLMTMVMALVSSTSVKQIAGRALEVNFSQMVVFSVLSSTLYVGAFVGLAAVWAFPVPFLFVLGGTPLLLCEILAAFAVVNVRAVVAKMQGLQKRMEGMYSLSSAVGMLYWIYPLYSVAFEYAGPKYQVAMLLVLPIVKAQWKQYVCRRQAGVEDLVPTIMMFTVDLFNSMYLATCMQLSRSPLVTAAIIVLDVVLGIVRVRRVHLRMAALLATIKTEKGKQGPGEWELLKWFLDRVQDDSVARLNGGLLATAHVRGNGLEHHLCESSSGILRALDAAKQNRVEPNQRGRTLSTSAASDDTALNQTLEFLFHCEFMVLTEYIECAIPMLYAVYLPFLYCLPNAAYYGHVHALSIDGLRYAELNIFVYWLFQLGSLVAVIMWLRRHFGLSVLHVLAFVLEVQVVYVQANVIFQIMVALHFTLAHLGTTAELGLSL